MSANEDYDGLDDDSLELEAVERRHNPRAPIPGLTVKVINAGHKDTFLVGEVGTESLFITGKIAGNYKSGEHYQIQISYGNRLIKCITTCIRTENAQRIGAVLKLAENEEEGRLFFAELINASAIPHGAH
jgi:hypothetical protein